MTDVNTAALISAAAGGLIAASLAAVKGFLASRASVNESLRELRLASYPSVWKTTSAVSRWPRNSLTIGELVAFHEELRHWYYETGGLYLSRTARTRYGDLQESLEAWLKGADPEASEPIPDDVYEGIMEVCSALRTTLTEDLETRRARSIIEALKRTRRNRRAARTAEACVDTLNEKRKRPQEGDPDVGGSGGKGAG